jgi:inhibitor of KinA sporulation pathway (predicted exonuclease)
MMNHVSLDLETWGKRAGCAIRSIGAVVFDPNAGPHDVLSLTFYQNVTLASCEKMKLHVDPNTAKWWAEQGEAARDSLEMHQVHLKTAVLNFNTWFRTYNVEFVWSHGAAFDVPIYEAVAVSVGFKPPWGHRGVRDTRTIFDLAGFSTEGLPFVGTKHNALDDAIHQAKCVQAAMKLLRRVPT